MEALFRWSSLLTKTPPAAGILSCRSENSGEAVQSYHIADSTVANVLKAYGIEPAPDRQRTPAWSTFLNAHWDSILANDFTTVELRTRSGLVTFCVLAVLH
jgi:hypothetical protein